MGHPASDSAPLAVRIDRSNPNHHLWLNNGTWYIHYTVCPTPATAERVRRSLRTKDLNEARKLRDQVLETHVLRQKEARPE
ncbi:MAG: hypothetical protein KJ626_10740 [Verrucomicrobia bacterium]|nr:hypothetical protein [Verrucomicrobiota bacterium]